MTATPWTKINRLTGCERSLIILYTDFGATGPYVGEMTMVLRRLAPDVPIVNLMRDAPRYNPKASAYLLRALSTAFQPGDVVLGIVDPGVGGARRAVVVEANGVLFVGPDNGLFSRILAEADDPAVWRIDWQPADLSSSFHGRDLFAPVAARLAQGLRPAGAPMKAKSLVGMGWPDDLAELIYIDPYGNAVSGLRARNIDRDRQVQVGGQNISYAKTFSNVKKGTAFWYENSNGLVEIAVNQGSAAEQLGLTSGTKLILY